MTPGTQLSLPPFAPDRPAAEVDAALRQALLACDRARECAVLWFAEVQRRELFRQLGHASLELYAVHELGFSRNRYWQFKRLADDLDRLPALRDAVANGRLGWTKAQQVARVADPQTQAAWIATAQATGRRELERSVMAAHGRRGKVKGAAGQLELGAGESAPSTGGAHLAPAQVEGEVIAGHGFAAPTREHPPATTITLRADGLQLARFEALAERARKRGLVPRDADRMEMVLAAFAALVEGASHGRCDGPATRIVVTQCPDCGQAAAVTARGEVPLAPAQAAAAACDARVEEPGAPNRATFPPSVRRAVLARDRHRCATPGCGATRFLEVHHVVPRSRGGTNRAGNLVTLCGRCHRFAHERAADPALQGTATSPTNESPSAKCTTTRKGPAATSGIVARTVSV